MASADKTNTKSGGTKNSLIDPLYQKFTKSVVRALGTTEFYEFFMDSIAHAQNRIQFSNRKLIKTVDTTWVDAIEEHLEAFQSIIASPRNIIQEEELIVNVANARKASSDVVRHLAQHASLVDQFDADEGDVRPNRLMQKYREDSVGLYENRLVYTTMEHAFQFVKIRHDALFSAMSDEFGAKLKVDSVVESATEHIHMDLFLHIKETAGALETDTKNQDVFERISRSYRVLQMFMNSQFAQQMAKLPRVKGAITKTNVLKKNKNYHKILELWDFLHAYDEIGYTIRVVEQTPEVNETFQRDIFHNVLFNYLILKGYLEDEKDRQLPVVSKEKRRILKPKFIREIIEELTEDYDLPDVEIRKVLIEELTKEQLMQEEEAERRRLVEEQERRKKEEAERLRIAEEAEKERLRIEQEAEKERIRLEKEAEEERLHNERMAREAEERRRCKLFQREFLYFTERLEENLSARDAAAAKKAAALQDFADAAAILEEAEQRKAERLERERKRVKEERDRILREKQLAAERAAKEEERRIEEARLEEERIRLEQEAEAEKARLAQIELDISTTEPLREEYLLFVTSLAVRKKEREDLQKKAKKERNIWEQERIKEEFAWAKAGK